MALIFMSAGMVIGAYHDVFASNLETEDEQTKKTSPMGMLEKHKLAFHGWIQSLTDRIQTLDFRSTSKSKEEVFSPYLMKYRPGKSEFDPDEKLEFKRTDMFDNVEFFTIGERAYFRKKANETPSPKSFE